MLNFHRSTGVGDGVKSPLKPALYDPPTSSVKPAVGRTAHPSSPQSTHARDGPGPGAAATNDGGRHATAPAPVSGALPVVTDTPESKLFVGANIKLKGVEISDCDTLVIEGHVEATVRGKLMQIAPPGTLKGAALVDVAEILGEFSGELTARTRLVVHATGRVSGTIRYGKLIVEEGGELSGEVKRLDAASAQAPQLGALATDSRVTDAAREAGLG